VATTSPSTSISGGQRDEREGGAEEIQRGSYALVLMDCHMPDMDGFEATERIRALANDASRIPIVALTASARREELAACPATPRAVISDA
jgi:CheY-like chemotaxis protein